MGGYREGHQFSLKGIDLSEHSGVDFSKYSLMELAKLWIDLPVALVYPALSPLHSLASEWLEFLPAPPQPVCGSA